MKRSSIRSRFQALWRTSNLLHRWLAAVIAFLVSSGCSDERSLPPVSVDYNLFVTVGKQGGIAIDVWDGVSGTALNRIPDAGSSGSTEIEVTKDGRYLVSFSWGSRLSVFDAQSFAMIATIESGAYSFALLTDPECVVASGLNGPSIVYGLPDLDTLASFAQRLHHTLRSPNPWEVLGLTWPIYGEKTRLLRIAIPSGVVLDSHVLVSPATQAEIEVWSLPLPKNAPILSPDESRLYFLGTDAADVALFAFDVATGQCLFRTPVATYAGSAFASLDGREVWVTQSWRPPYRPTRLNTGYILIVDASSGLPLDTIKSVGLNMDFLGYPVQLAKVAFHPLEPIAYAGAILSRPGVLKINTQTRAVEECFYDSVFTFVYDVAFAPKASGTGE